MTPQITVALLGQAICSAFAVGALLLLLLTALPSTRLVARQLWPILVSEALILAAGFMPWLLPHFGLLAILLAAAARIGFESGTVHGRSAGRDFRTSHMVLLVVASGAAWWAGSAAVVGTVTVLLLVALAVMRLRDGTTVLGSLARFAIFPMLPLAAFSHAASDASLAPVLVLAFFLVEVFDSFSLLGGRLFGRTPLVPRLSPRKTWEGFAAGAATVVLTVLGLAAWLDLPILPMIVAGLAVIASALAGDLLGSAAKRLAGVKDYPAVMKVQGGLLDIADSWLVAGPCLAAIFTIWTKW